MININKFVNAMRRNIIFYDYELSEFKIKFQITKLINGQYELKIKKKYENLQFAKINKYEEVEIFISYLDMMFNLLQKIFIFRSDIYNIENFDFNPPAWKVINIFDMNVNTFIRLKDEKRIEMVYAKIIYNQTINLIERKIDKYIFYLIIIKLKNEKKQYINNDICNIIYSFL
jgi:hypothetical protein